MKRLRLKKIHKLNFNKIKINKKLLIFLLTISIIAFISGILLAILLNKDDKTSILSSINEYINLCNSKLSYSYLKNSFINCFIFIIIIYLLGFSIIGIPIIILLIFYKVFSFSFSIGTFLINYKFKGLLFTFAYIPHNIIYLISLILLSIYSINLSIKLVKSIILKQSINFNNISSKYFYIFKINFIIVILYTLYDFYILPFLVKLIF